MGRFPIFKYLGTSTFHAEHHEHLNYNYGFYTLIWDKLFGTLDPEYVDRFSQASEQDGSDTPPPLQSRSPMVKRNLNQNRRGAPSSGWQTFDIEVFGENKIHAKLLLCEVEVLLILPTRLPFSLV